MFMKNSKLLSIILGLVLLVLAACNNNESKTVAVSSEDVSAFPSKEITFVVPYSPGGGFDTSVRLIAPYMEKYLPNDATIIVKNAPGGEGNVGLSEIERAKPDGHTIGLANLPGHYANQVMDTAKYDLLNMEYVGNITTLDYITTLSAKSKYKTIEDLQNADVVNAGVVSVSSTDGLGLMAFAEELGINLNIITHEGSSEALLAAVRGDVDIVQFPYTSSIDYVETGDLVPLVMHSKERATDYPDIQTVGELGYEDLLNVTMGNRTIIATPGTPEEILTVLREAFDKAVADPDYMKQAEEAGLEFNSSNWENAEKLSNDGYNAMMSFKDLMMQDK